METRILHFSLHNSFPIFKEASIAHNSAKKNVYVNKEQNQLRKFYSQIVIKPIVALRQLCVIFQIFFVVINAKRLFARIKSSSFTTQWTKEATRCQDMISLTFIKNLSDLRLKKMVNLNKMLAQRTANDFSVIAYGRLPINTQRHVLIIRVNNVAQVFVCDILLRKRNVFCLASYQEIICKFHL